jgi:hypothetical protein
MQLQKSFEFLKIRVFRFKPTKSEIPPEQKIRANQIRRWSYAAIFHLRGHALKANSGANCRVLLVHFLQFMPLIIQTARLLLLHFLQIHASNNLFQSSHDSLSLHAYPFRVDFLHSLVISITQLPNQETQLLP